MASIIEALIPSVHDMLSLREALSKIAHCEKALRTSGPCSAVENFDILYTCYHYIKDLKEDTIGELLNYLIKGMQLLESELKKVLSERGSGEQQHQRVTYLNALKIFTYLTVEFINYLERKHLKSKEDELMPVSGKAKSGGKKTNKKTGAAEISLTGDSSGAYDWSDVREKLLECLSKLLLLNIQKLWDPPIAEEQFVIMITNLCYKLMENLPNQSLRQQQRKSLKDLLCHILGIMIKKYNHSYGACVMIIQTLPHYDHLSGLYADLVQTCVVELGYESILAEILREFRHTILGGGGNAVAGGNNKEKDNPNNKFYSQFLIDLVDRLPQHLMPYISLVQDFLDDDSYLMRNAVLYIYGELCVRVLNAEATERDLKLKQIRNELLDTLFEHVHDSNALTRSKTLQIWRTMAEHKAVPLNYIPEVMKRCISRMDDVASSVRKSAFQLLCDFIRNNPYGIRSIEMSQDEVKSELEKEETLLNQLKEEGDKLIEEINRQLEENSAKSQKSSPEETEMDTDETTEGNKTMTAAVTTTTDEDDVKAQAEKQRHQERIVVQTCKVNFLRDMMNFVNQIDEAMPKIARLLFSKTQTDVLEVISFFVTCYEHGFNDMLVGIRKMLGLVFNSEKPIKDAVINAYKRLYLKADGNDPDTTTAASVQVAKQLIKLVNDLTICERQALEELIGEFVISNELNNSVVKILWEYFATPETTSPKVRLNAIILLGMVIRRMPAKGRANLEVLVDYGLIHKESGEKMTDYEMLIFKETCLTVSHITPDASTKQLTQLDTNHAGGGASTDTATGKKKKGKSGAENNRDESYLGGDGGEGTQQRRLQFTIQPFKLPNTHQVYERISQTIVSQFDNMTTDHWLPMCEQAMACIFKTADGPFGIVEDIFIKLVDKLPFKSIFHSSESSLSQRVQQLPPVPLFNGDAESPVVSGSQSSSTITQTNLLARFFNFVGVVATKFLIFLNQIVVCELKRRKMYKENVEKKDSAASKAKAAKDRRRSMKLKNMRKSINPGSLDLEEEMGLQGAEAEDVEQMFIENLLDLRVASGHQDSLIANILPVCVNILKDPIKYPNQHLQLACSMCLIRMMILSQVICNEHLQLIFTLMKKSTNPMVRSHLILGIGDLVYRFPNALEPWTSHLYLPLRDTRSPEVRMNTIRVLSHLILKEMIKIKGQIYEIALCIIDPDTKISSLAKVFFNELAQRNNGLVIYNAMPDMISQLSGGGGADIKTSQEHLSARVITEESFRSIITYLFTFIKRDKQCETLIEKLCMSLREVHREERKTRDIVFCLTKIQLNDSGIKKLKETFKMYAEKLTIPSVYDMFKQMIKNARKATNLKNESKQLLDELEKQMDEVKQRGVDDQQEVEMKNGDAAETERKDNDVDDDEEDEEDMVQKSPKKTQRAVKPTARPPSVPVKSGRNVSMAKKTTSTSSAAGKSTKSKKNVAPARSSRRRAVSSSDEDNDKEESDEEDESASDESD